MGSTVEPGNKAVLELYESKRFPIPHGLSGYALLVELEPEDLRPGRVIKLSSASAKPYLSVFRAPQRQTTTSIAGTLTILTVEEGVTTAHVLVESHDAQWTFRGRARFKATESMFFRQSDKYIRLYQRERRSNYRLNPPLGAG